jgi:glycosyltransferase involved in cell wall biosynthesis
MYIARNNFLSRPALAGQVYQICKEYKVWGVICHFFGVDHLVVGTAAKAARVAAIAVSLGNPAPSWDHARRAAMKWASLIRASTALGTPLVSASAYIQQTFSELAALPAGSAVIHYGCDVRDINSKATRAREKRDPDGPFTVGMVSRLDPIKDHECLLKAFAMLRATRPDTLLKLVLAGDGILAPRLQQMAKALDINKQVTFLGTRSDVPCVLGQLDLFAFSTTAEEGFGIALIEALAAGVPVVATDVPACREVLRNGEFGELIAPGEPALLAAALGRAIDSKNSHGERLQPATKRVLQFYDNTIAAEKHLALLASTSQANLCRALS